LKEHAYVKGVACSAHHMAHTEHFIHALVAMTEAMMEAVLPDVLCRQDPDHA